MQGFSILRTCLHLGTLVPIIDRNWMPLGADFRGG